MQAAWHHQACPAARARAARAGPRAAGGAHPTAAAGRAGGAQAAGASRAGGKQAARAGRAGGANISAINAFLFLILTASEAKASIFIMFSLRICECGFVNA